MCVSDVEVNYLKSIRFDVFRKYSFVETLFVGQIYFKNSSVEIDICVVLTIFSMMVTYL